MKKFAIYFALLIGVGLMVSSCLKDKGNYTYTNLPDFYIDTVGQQTSFQAYQNQGTVNINPKVVYAGDTANLTYRYTLYASSGAIDTLGTTKNLSKTITRAPGTYTIELEATEKTSGVKAFMRYGLVVLPPVAPGMMVLYEKNNSPGNSEIDVISSPAFTTSTPAAVDSVFRGLYAQFNHNELLPGLPVPNGFSFYVSPSGTTPVYVATTKSFVSLQRTDFQRLQNTSDLFLNATPATLNIEGVFAALSGFNLVNNGEVYWSQDGVLVGKYAVGGGYKAASHLGYMTGFTTTFFDEQNGRFIRGLQFNSLAEAFSAANAGRKFSLHNIQKKLLFYDRIADPNKFALFKDFNSENRYIYVTNPSTPQTPDVALIDVTGAPNINDAFLYAAGSVNTTAFYATPASVYYFTYSTSNSTYSTPVAGFTAPAGEVITAMKLHKSVTFAAVPAGTLESRQMFIGTWNPTTKVGKVYYVTVDATSGVMSAPVKSWTINGKVGAFHYKS